MILLFNLVSEETELASGTGTVTALARSFQWCKPHFHSSFRSYVISGFYRANSTWTEYRPIRHCHFEDIKLVVRVSSHYKNFQR